MPLSLDARRDRLLTNSLPTQTSGAGPRWFRFGPLHEGSSVRLTQPSIGEVPTASLESCRLSSRAGSHLQVPSQDIRTSGHASRRDHKPHSLSQLANAFAVADLVLVRRYYASPATRPFPRKRETLSRVRCVVLVDFVLGTIQRRGLLSQTHT